MTTDPCPLVRLQQITLAQPYGPGRKETVKAVGDCYIRPDAVTRLMPGYDSNGKGYVLVHTGEAATGNSPGTWFCVMGSVSEVRAALWPEEQDATEEGE